MRVQDKEAVKDTMRHMRRTLAASLLLVCLTGCTQGADPGIPTESPQASESIPSETPTLAPDPGSIDETALAAQARAAQEAARTISVGVEITNDTDEEALGTSTSVDLEACAYTLEDVSARTITVQGDVAVETSEEGTYQVLTAPTGGIITSVILPDGLCNAPGLLAALELQEVEGQENLYEGVIVPERLQGEYEARINRVAPGDAGTALLAEVSQVLTVVSDTIDRVEVELGEEGLITRITIESLDVNESLLFVADSPQVQVTLPPDYTPLDITQPEG